ncbi:MAG: DNA-binding protein, partial [Nitrospirota bacterium]|nr:DNA-binding protein [Nitrospirota bacterium]
VSKASKPHGTVQAAGAAEEGSLLSGKVIETMNSGGYSYINIEKAGKKTWVAVPETKVTVGKEMSFEPGVVMQNFKSSTLGRTFESIVFSGGIAGGNGAAPAASSHSSAKSAPVKKVKVDKASGPNAYTVAELHKKSAELDKKGVVVRGQVVKVSAEIMGKNWIHIQDGSGDASKGTDDLTVTSKDIPAVGDVITVKGTLYKDKDFTMGYKYAVIIEEATFSK